MFTYDVSMVWLYGLYGISCRAICMHCGYTCKLCSRLNHSIGFTATATNLKRCFQRIAMNNRLTYDVLFSYTMNRTSTKIVLLQKEEKEVQISLISHFLSLQSNSRRSSSRQFPFHPLFHQTIRPGIPLRLFRGTHSCGDDRVRHGKYGLVRW